MGKLTQETLRDILHYNPHSGVWVWKIAINKIKVGDIAGNITNKLYKRICINNVRYLSSRLAFLYMEGHFPVNEVDHIDRDSTNDKWLNLREATRKANVINRSKGKKNKSGVMGVHWDKSRDKWLSSIRIDKVLKSLGRFADFSKAVMCRYNAEIKYGFLDYNPKSTSFMYLKKQGLL